MTMTGTILITIVLATSLFAGPALAGTRHKAAPKSPVVTQMEAAPTKVEKARAVAMIVMHGDRCAVEQHTSIKLMLEVLNADADLNDRATFATASSAITDEIAELGEDAWCKQATTIMDGVDASFRAHLEKRLARQ
jgi:hypothetical protein